MDCFEVEEILKTMKILVDTREQPTERAQHRFDSFSVPYERVTLDYGDYSYNAMIDGKWLYNGFSTIKPSVIIERKMNLDELAMCFGSERKRFEAEMERASVNQASIYIIVENATWESLINGRYRSRYNSKAMLASITAWMARYEIKPIFCKEETTGKMIQEILFRELKERLSNGWMGKNLSENA